MSLLSSFTNDFNATISILSRSVGTDNVWQRKEIFTESEKDIKCLIMMNKFQIDQTIWKEISYYKSTHYVRLELWPVAKVGDKIKDQSGKEYDVKFVYENPGFGGDPDHLVLYVDVIDARADTVK